jgi:N-acetylglutamate synthase-like GNAT family acetyltransferase
MFTIRPFRQEDQKEARRLILRGLGEHFGYIDISQNPDLKSIWESYVEQGHLFYVAEAETGIVGTGGLVVRNYDLGEIVRLFVVPEMRRTSLGKAIVNRLIEEGKALQIVHFTVETNTNWHEAIQLYRHCGFQEVDRDELLVYLSLN